MKLSRIVACFLVLGLLSTSSSALHNISLLVLAPNPRKEGEPDYIMSGWNKGPALYPATRIAIREINQDENILPDFHLQSIEADTACLATTQTVVSMVRHVFQESQNQVVGIIGPGCSEAALTVSNLTRRNEVSILHITQGNNPRLEENFRNTTFASVSSALFYVSSFIELMRNRGWTRIATLVDDRKYFQQTHTRFIEEVERNKFDLLTSNTISVNDDLSVIPLENVINSRARIIFVFAQRKVAAQLMCYAYHLGMLFPDYQWIFHDRSKSNFILTVNPFRVEKLIINCSMEEMNIATEGIVLNRFNLKRNDRDTILPLFNKTYNDYWKEYKDELEIYKNEKNLNIDNTPTSYANSYHDAVWALALALHNASRNGLDLRNYRYNKNSDTKKIAESLFQIQFMGQSGRITFRRETRSIRSLINLYQLISGREKLIGRFDDSAEEKLQFEPEGMLKFIEDSVRYETKHERIHMAFGVIIILLTLVFSVITFMLQLSNIMCYNYHSIKATSPNLNHLIFSGCYLFMIAILVLTIRETFVFNQDINSVLYSILCNTLTWCFALGYSLIFGTVCVKTWRVYRLFRHFQNESPGMCLSDDSLSTQVMLLLAIDICICTTWNLVDPWILHATPHEILTSNSEIATVIIRSDCICKHTVQWIGSMVAYKGVLTLGLVALSILNRRVKRKNFQHTRKINILIYGTTMGVSMGLPLYFLLKKKSIYIGFVMLLLLLMSTLVLCLLVIFLPPVIPVLKMKLTKNKSKPILRSIFSTNSFLFTP